MACIELRRRKEMELEVMLGNIRNFDGLSIETYGSIIKMEPAISVLIRPVWQEAKKDCYLVLFPRVLMVLSVGKELTSFTYESMMTLENARLQMIHPAGEAISDLYRFECSGHSAHPKSELTCVLTYLVQLATDEVWKDWCQAVQRQIRHCTRGPVSGSGSPLIDRNSSSNGSSLASPMSGPASVLPSSSSTSGNAPVLPTPSSSSSLSSPRQSAAKPPVPPTEATGRVTSKVSTARRPPPAAPLPSAEIIASLPKMTANWTEQQQFISHLPYRPFDVTNSKISTHESMEQNDEDMKILHLIDNYCRKLPINGAGGGSAAGSLKRDGSFSTRTKKISNPSKFFC